jgi:hypothetical protein
MGKKAEKSNLENMCSTEKMNRTISARLEDIYRAMIEGEVREKGRGHDYRRKNHRRVK